MTRKVFRIFFAVIDKEREPIIDVSAQKVKGKKELKNLECSINFEARDWRSSPVNCQRRRGFYGFKNVFSFPPEV